MALQVGDKAPEFTLRNSEKEIVNLKDYRGKNVVLLFFPMAFTGVCTKEMCEMRDNIGEYGRLNAEILAVSVDSVFTLGKWKKDEGFNFQMLSDFNKTVSKKYETIYKDFVFEMKGVSKRSAFVIDKTGTIQYAEVLDNAGEIPNFVAVQKVLSTL